MYKTTLHPFLFLCLSAALFVAATQYACNYAKHTLDILYYFSSALFYICPYQMFTCYLLARTPLKVPTSPLVAFHPAHLHAHKHRHHITPPRASFTRKQHY
mmetsp:Transcript_46222/g.119125  ORF Transcript_46222/g.119125 Transcript_46222/m.119125 type:complete len:101 (-) Transcript_46222:688-990(-)